MSHIVTSVSAVVTAVSALASVRGPAGGVEVTMDVPPASSACSACHAEQLVSRCVPGRLQTCVLQELAGRG